MTEPTALYRLTTDQRVTAEAVAVITARGDLRRVAREAALRIGDATGRAVDDRSLAESLVSAFNAWAKDALEIRQAAQQ